MTRVAVEGTMLRWARERAGRTQESLKQKFAHVADWETGELQPTLKQLEAFAKAVHVPIGYLFLREPPEEPVPIPDFRTVADQPLRRASPDLLDTVYLCQQRQEWFRDDARQAGAQPIPFVGSLSLSADVVRSASSIRTALGFDLEAQRRLPTWTDAMRRFIELADALGVLVMVSGVVGSNNQRPLDPEEFRGFALADPLAPLVFINGADTKAAQLFTLAHELAHLWLGESALSDACAAEAPTQVVERWCNRVAAEMLIPLSVFSAVHDPEADLRGELDRLARRFKVSTLVVLRRMHDASSLMGDAYWRAYNAEVERLQELSGGSGGNFYLTLGARVSKRFARAVVSSTLEGRSSFTEAFRLLGFKKMSTFKELSTSLGVPM
jgi:Zn-dependent peptidase ImmA (M78 family)/transcriptional regulator with XRE-family HTH domain